MIKAKKAQKIANDVCDLNSDYQTCLELISELIEEAANKGKTQLCTVISYEKEDYIVDKLIKAGYLVSINNAFCASMLNIEW